MASVSYRKIGNRWYIRFRRNGRKEITKSYPTSVHEETIKRKAQNFDEQIAFGQFDPWEHQRKPDDLRLALAIEYYIADGIDSGRWKTDAAGNSLTARTNRKRLTYMKEAIGSGAVSTLRTENIRDWLLRKDISSVTKQSWKTTINTFLSWLYDRRYTDNQKKVTLPARVQKQARKIIERPAGISFDKLQTFCMAAKQRAEHNRANKYYRRDTNIGWVADAGQLAFWCMLRRREIINLYPDDISEDFHYITIGNEGTDSRPKFIPKSGIDTIPLLSPAREVLESMNMKTDKPLFDYSYEYIHVAFKRVSMQAFGKNYSPHTFRHGGIIHLRSVLTQPGLVSRLARHSSQAVTEAHYGGVDPVYLRRALANEKLL